MSSSNEKSPSRAEQLRMRRNQHSKQRVSGINVARKTGNSNSARLSTPAAKVTTRLNNSSYQPVSRQTRSQVKKRVTIPLKSPGAELNLPSIPVFASGWRLLSGSLSIVFLGCIIALSLSPAFQVNAVDFQGFQRINANDAAVVLGMESLPVFMVDPQNIQQELVENFADLKDISVRVSFPADVKIQAQERTPIVVWQYGEQTLWIDEEGIVFPPRSTISAAQSDEISQDMQASEESGSKSLLTIRSDAPPPEPPPPPRPEEEAAKSKILPGEALLNPGIQSLPTQVDMAIILAAQTLAKYVTPGTVIVYDTLNGLGWSDARGWNVYIGSRLENIELKLVEYQAIVEQLEMQAVRPAMISVEYVHAPFYRLE